MASEQCDCLGSTLTHFKSACEGIISDQRSATRSDLPDGYQTYSVRGASG